AELVGQAARDHLDAVAAPVLVVVADFLVTDPVADHLLQGTGQIADARHDLDRATQRLTLVLALDLAPLVKAKPLEVQPTVVVFSEEDLVPDRVLAASVGVLERTCVMGGMVGPKRGSGHPKHSPGAVCPSASRPRRPRATRGDPAARRVRCT